MESVYAHVWEASLEALEWYVGRGFEVREGVVGGYYRRLRPQGARVVWRGVGEEGLGVGREGEGEKRGEEGCGGVRVEGGRSGIRKGVGCGVGIGAGVGDGGEG